MLPPANDGGIICRQTANAAAISSGGISMRKSLAISALLAGALTAASSVTSAQTGSFINLGTIGSFKTYAGSGSNANRIGNGVLLFVHQISGEFSTSAQVVAACNGSWLSTPFRFAYVEAPNVSAAETAAREQVPRYPIEPIDLADWSQQTEIQFGAALKRHVKEICRTAAAEPRNWAIPVSIFAEKTEDSGGSISFLSGTIVRKGAVIEAWTRTSYFTREPIMVQGKPFLIGEVAQHTKKATGAYDMKRISVHCTDRQMTTYQTIEYDIKGITLNEISVPRDRAEFSAVAPGTVGEAQLDALCRIYGGKVS